MQDILNINKSEYTSIFANRDIWVKNHPSLGALLRKIKYLTKRDLTHLAKLRDLVVDETDLVNIIQILLKSVLGPKLKGESYRELEIRKYNKVINKVKRLKRLKNSPLAEKENISEKDLYELTILTTLPTQSIKKLAQLRGVETTGLKRHDVLSILMRTEKHNKEKSYLKHLQSDPVSQRDTLINLISREIIKLKDQKKTIRNRNFETYS